MNKHTVLISGYGCNPFEDLTRVTKVLWPTRNIVYDKTDLPDIPAPSRDCLDRTDQPGIEF